MSDPAPTTKNLNPHTVAAQAAALARHLQYSGVAFLPVADPDAVARLQSDFAPAIQDAPSRDARTQHAASQDTASSAVATRPSSPSPTSPSKGGPSPSGPSKSGSQQSKPSPTRSPVPPVVADPVEASYAGPSLAQADRVAKLEVLSQVVAECTRCEQLAACRTQTVFGEGSVMPRFVFFGEGPGADEDRTGRPFVGKAGQLLTKMIEACSLRREDVYILNTVKCRPPGNRNPDPDEQKNCREYFEQQFALLRPEYIVCMGAISSQALLNSKLSVGRLRGKFHRYFDSKVLVTYHPAYLLRNPDAKKAAWQDLQLMLRDAGIKI